MSIEQEVFGSGVAVVTGAGAGIGSGIARRLGQLGMHVVVTDIAGDRAEAVAAAIRAQGGRAEAQTLDVSRPAELDRLAADLFRRHGAVKLLVNNAGIETIGFSWEVPAERWETTLNVNIHGAVHGVRAFVPHMLKAGQPAWIANLASVGSFGVMPTQTAYIMSKHAVQSFSECLFLELQMAKAPIRVSSVIPGMLKTSIFDEAGGKGEPPAASHHRKVMRELMSTYGMDLDEGCQRIVAQIAEGRFWVSTQPEMTTGMIAGRVDFLTRQTDPTLSEQARHLLES
ncbi:SDR family NAD(P)-dependent oxidoreductase [Nitrospirillum bahiense]|uniref:NADP-dependent 3-hydroxy acid dehydrogenase YdfG n=1 Tax=Nitrospirillum amazonense TaxID=28077 RepID=A0A560FVI4_9PROT|nr:SDR family NAD(P)-dependent oxidoreductase [Nitrospirillum amazonense]TWB25647.1 NADP-dependent 3-hydroxy acid dehydrogenase YdfG [Nitrospirillum amazonense]